MTDISVSKQRLSTPKKPFNSASYVKPIFSMFDGETEHITAIFDNAYLNLVIDRFGDNVRLQELENDCFQAEFKAAVSPTFLSWMIGFGDGAIIVSPEWVADEIKRLALDTANMYEEAFGE